MEVFVLRPTYREAVVHWKQKAYLNDRAPWVAPGCSVTIDVTDLTDPVTVTFVGEAAVGWFGLPREVIKAGHSYRVEVKALEQVGYDIPGQDAIHNGMVLRVIGYRQIASAVAEFRAEFTLEELKQLMDIAVKYSEMRSRQFMVCEFFYRNKTPEYFKEICVSHKNVMKVYIKDHNGDPASVINGQINGLFFSVCVDKDTGKPSVMSHYGTKRLLIPAHLMMATAPNLYFADFYCNKTAHYVTLVMTSTDSPVDKFCASKLLKLNIEKNPFLKQNSRDGRVWVTSGIWVEVLFTENIDIDRVLQDGAFFWPLPIPSTGTSKPSGIPKNPQCSLCNLYPS